MLSCYYSHFCCYSFFTGCCKKSIAYEKSSPKNSTFLSLITAFLVATFYWNKAQKETAFLCGKFKQGVSEQSVRRQPETGNLLQYRTENLPADKRIIAHSRYNLGMHKCVVNLDSKGMVKESWIE